MNIAISGSRGLIGSFLVERLIQRGDKILLSIDRRSGTTLKDIDQIKISNIDVCIHLASFCKINETIRDPSLAYTNNVEGTFKVLEFCRVNKIPKLVFTSSSRILSKEKNPYTASKVYGEELIKAYSQCYGLNYSIIRPSTVYGPFNDLTSRLMDIFILSALQDQELKIFGNKNKTLDFTYIDDFLEGFLLAMEQPNSEFDISAGKGISVDYLADLIIQLAGKGKKVYSSPEIAQPQEVELDIIPLTQLGYSPKISIDDGVKRTFDWYKENFEAILRSRSSPLTKTELL